MKKVCIVTAARSEYGVMRWTIDAINKDPELELQLVVTGAHLIESQGFTYKTILDDGFNIAAYADMKLNSGSKKAIVESMGHCSIAFAEVFQKLSPDLLLVVGDRYELLPICSAALVMNIPIAHISGGDVTEGAIDNEVRNAITMMSVLHFPGVMESAKNIERMRQSNKNIFCVGEPGLESFIKEILLTRKQLAENLCIPYSSRWLLVTLHPETQQSLEYNINMAENLKSMLDLTEDTTVVITKANTDFGGNQINKYWETVVTSNPQKYSLFSSLGHIRYLSFMKECYAVIGNSSSGIFEAPIIGTPVINIGNRQKGRHLCHNVHQADNSLSSICETWKEITINNNRLSDTYYGDGNTSLKIVSHIKDYFNGI